MTEPTPDDDVRAVDLPLPRLQAGFPPQHLLISLLGEHVLDTTLALPSAALAATLADFGITAGSARAAISRLSRRGLLEGSRQGRRTSYHVTDLGREALAMGQRRIFGFTPGRQSWDGHWTFVAFSVPEASRSDRSRLRVRLGNLGLAPLYDGLWVTPHKLGDEVAEVMAGVKTATFTVVVGSDLPGTGRLRPLAAWDLDPVSEAYEEFVTVFGEVTSKLQAGMVGPAEALVERLRLLFRWFSLANTDPDLPVAMLPENWRATEARDLFVEVYNGLGPLAELRLRQIVSELSADLAGNLTHYTL